MTRWIWLPYLILDTYLNGITDSFFLDTFMILSTLAIDWCGSKKLSGTKQNHFDLFQTYNRYQVSEWLLGIEYLIRLHRVILIPICSQYCSPKTNLLLRHQEGLLMSKLQINSIRKSLLLWLRCIIYLLYLLHTSTPISLNRDLRNTPIISVQETPVGYCTKGIYPFRNLIGTFVQRLSSTLIV